MASPEKLQEDSSGRSNPASRVHVPEYRIWAIRADETTSRVPPRAASGSGLLRRMLRLRGLD
jgi:hypothetical protein